ncbi:hypothetical protein TRVL_05925 [Trypanosoma vivax]|nr:hypothetical protein TRVL_05925 [Trypanosoma vivax]
MHWIESALFQNTRRQRKECSVVSQRYPRNKLNHGVIRAAPSKYRLAQIGCLSTIAFNQVLAPEDFKFLSWHMDCHVSAVTDSRESQLRLKGTWTRSAVPLVGC